MPPHQSSNFIIPCHCRAPFDELQPYAETGPIFLKKDSYERYDSNVMPTWLDHFEPAIIRGYNEQHYIRYDTGQVLAGKELSTACRNILMDATIVYLLVLANVQNWFQPWVINRLGLTYASSEPGISR